MSLKTKVDWSVVDWRDSNGAIAVQVGLSKERVHQWRARVGKPYFSFKRKRPSKNYICQRCHRPGVDNYGRGKTRKYHARCAVLAVAAKLRVTNAKPENVKRFCGSAKALAGTMRARATDKRFQPGVEHMSAKWWHVRAPNGIAYRFKNMREFVRTHPYLFDEGLAVWRTRDDGRVTCKADAGLRSLFQPSGKACSWHGWVAVSIQEVRRDSADDPLQRERESETTEAIPHLG